MTVSSEPIFQQVRGTSASLETVVDALKAAIVAADVWVLHEINPQTLLRQANIEIGPARQLLFFHPRYMKRLLDADPAAVLEVPLKFAVLTEDTGIALRWFDPVRAFERYRNRELKALGAELSLLCDQIVASALETAS
ncbi:DUF302 domain-containing protein [Phenylobacterium sp.]|jgi:uncharacterized protein (DUF302 family)|uniref:DUF302 domain-containing protein n=1 Tax=Phenylobacterium sp. TaxID=1871053 RepID=UPI0025FE189D|nr:DUF302 domain-containing protein [Phenylobacterium sp.]